MQKEIKKYLLDVSHSNTEEAKKLLFITLLSQLFKKDEAAKEIISQLSRGAEQTILNIPIGGRLKTGRADTQYRRVIIEFENDLAKTKAHAEDQLKEYFAGNWNSGKPYDYVLISTDCIRWIIYGVTPESYLGKEQLNPRELELKVVDHFVLNDLKTDEFFPFIDRYLFRFEKQVPTLENIQIDFGESSPLFMNVIGAMKAFYKEHSSDPEISTAYDEWNKFLSVAYGSFHASDNIFLVHTYLSVFSKLLAYAVISHDAFIDDEEILEVLKGKIFDKFHIENFVENDFYRWISNESFYKQLRPQLRKIATAISDYDFSNVKSDILKGVYQELIDLETRHALGEYYTPDWLCQQVAEHLDFKRDSSVLDPACGSGSIIMAVVTRMKQLHPDITAEELASQIQGIDIHPLSVQIAKTTLLIGFGNMLRNVKRPIQLKIFLANSIISPQTAVTMFDTEFQVKVDNQLYDLQKGAFDNPGFYDYAISVADHFADITLNKKPESEQVFYNNLKKANPKLDALLSEDFYKIYLALKKAKEEGRDSIWKFILQNTYKPFFLKESFDFVIGNPPWFTYSSIKNAEYQTLLKKLADKYRITPEKKANMPNLEIAAIFLAHSCSYYLKEKGKLAFVLPRSFISAEHHDNTRSGNAKGFSLTEVWDLEKVIPLFRIPSCVLFASHSNISIAIPETGIAGRAYKGRINQHNATWNEVADKISYADTTWFYSKLNKVSALTPNLRKDYQVKTNFYKNYFLRGNDIIPRNFYYVQLESETPSDFKNRIISIASSDENDKDAKKPWKGMHLKGNVNSNFLFRTALSKNIVPFALIAPPLVILPIVVEKNRKIKLSNHTQLLQSGENETASWFRKVEGLWNENKTEANKNNSSVDYLNWRNKLLDQDLSKKYLVLYTASSKDANSCIVNREMMETEFIVDGKAYAFYTDNLDEANFLTCFLNSNFTNATIKDFQSKGLFGPRDVHKKILDVPLPQFNPENKLHQKLATLGASCTQKVSDYIATNNLQSGNYNVGAVRVAIRKLLKKELEEVDEVLGKMIE